MNEIVRKRIITKNRRDTEATEDLPGDELIEKTFKYGKEPKTK